MSDRILNDQRYAVFCKSVIDRGTCTLHDQYAGHWNGDFGICDKDPRLSIRDFFNKTGGSRRFYQERKCSGPGYIAAHDESYHYSHRGGTYIQELECISSNLMRLLSKARQRNVKVKASCGSSQRQHRVNCNETHANPDGYRPNCTDPQHKPNSNDDYRIHNAGELLSQLEGLIKSTSNGALRTSVSNTAAADKSQTPADVDNDDYPTQTSDETNSDLPEMNEKKKKETHNQSEKKRRIFINNKITELRNLLPDHIDRASCKKKGMILKESIEYIKQLRQDHDRIQNLQRRMNETETEIKRLTFKLKQLESQISTLASNSEMQTSTSDQSENNTESSQYENTNGLDSSPTLHPTRSTVLTTVPVRQELGHIWDDLSTSLTSFSATSGPLCPEMEDEAMEYYTLT